MTQQTSVSRRAFIVRGMIGSAVLGIPAGGIAWMFRDNLKNLQPKEIVTYLKANFDYLDFEMADEQWHQFSLDYTRHYGDILREHWGRLKRRDKSHHQGKLDDLAVTFLMSTDFFLNGADETRTVKFVTLYHPYVSPCWNPVSMAAAAELS